jgi:alkanesulfonate monooxygenase SsuD/methylene tetrahydromethanopterin reductase-like flavin-dependent oxidoreductase (luciferase family)
MSRGRVELGIGAGWFEAEHQAYAIPFPPLGERFDRLTEQLDIITGPRGNPGHRNSGHRTAHSGSDWLGSATLAASVWPQHAAGSAPSSRAD